MAETIGVLGGPAVVNQVASMYPSVVLLEHDVELVRSASPNLRAVVIDVDEGDVDTDLHPDCEGVACAVGWGRRRAGRRDTMYPRRFDAT